MRCAIPKIPVCVFAKPPICGQVKTRLSNEFTLQQAADLAGAMLRDVWNTVRQCRGTRPVLAAACEGQFPIEVPADDFWLQSGSNLGERIESILQRGLAHASAAIALGADSPLVSTATIEHAIEALGEVKAVLGRCLDGGFYLLGIRECPSGWLAGVPWSASETADVVGQRLTARYGHCLELETLLDVDTPRDVKALAALLQDETAQRQAPESYALLRRWRPERNARC